MCWLSPRLRIFDPPRMRSTARSMRTCRLPDDSTALHFRVSLEELKMRAVRLERMLEEMTFCGYQRAESVEQLLQPA